MFSKTCEYAIRAVVYISAAANRENKTGIIAISENIDAPAHFTAKILQTLGHHHIVSSRKGVRGGFYLDAEQKKRKLIDVVRAIDGDMLFSGCGLGLKYCSEERPCPLHNKFKSIREDLKQMMEQTTIEEMAKTLRKGHVLLRNDEK